MARPRIPKKIDLAVRLKSRRRCWFCCFAHGKLGLELTGQIAQRNPVIEEFVAEREAKGRAEGSAKAILSIPEARARGPRDAVRRRILRCAEPDLLERWLRRAATASSADDMLDIEPGEPSTGHA